MGGEPGAGPSGPVRDAELLASQAFITELGKALLEFGMPAHRLEEALASVSRRLGLEGEFFAVPTALIASFRAGLQPTTHLVRCDPGEANLEKLWLLSRTVDDVLAGKLSVPAGAARAREIVASSPRFGAVATTVAGGLLSAALAIVYGGSAVEAAAACVIGLLVAALRLLTRRSAGFDRLFDVLAAAIATTVAYAAARYVGAGLIHLTALTGLIALLPGLSLTVALTELSTMNLVSGTARLAHAGITFLKLGLGVALGGRLGVFLFGGSSSVVMQDAPVQVAVTGLVFAALAFTVLFQARPRDGGWILLASVLTLVAANVGDRFLGSALGSSLGAFVATVVSNVHARVFGGPARVLLIPSVVLLVPGSIGFRSVSLLLERDVLTGVNTAFLAALAAMALAAGMMLASALVPPRRLL